MRGDEVRAPTAALKLKTFFIGEVKVCLIRILSYPEFVCLLPQLGHLPVPGLRSDLGGGGGGGGRGRGGGGGGHGGGAVNLIHAPTVSDVK